MTEFESLFQLMDTIREHLTLHAMNYGIGGVFFFIVVFFTRQYTVPVILYAVETTIYLFGMHLIIALVVSFFSWLHNSTSMKAIREKQPDVDWDIPWVYFWHTEEYNPEWIYMMELVFTVIIIALVIRYRPIKIQRVRQQTEAAKKGEFKPDQMSSRNRAQELGKKYANPENIGKGGKGKSRF